MHKGIGRALFATLWLIGASGCGDSSGLSAETTAGGAGTAIERSSLTVTGVRPEAFSWFWNNQREALLQQANAEVRSFVWQLPPAQPEHLGYAAGARSETVAVLDGVERRIVATTLEPSALRGRVAADNFLCARPYSFLAQTVQIDGAPAFEVLVQYLPSGATHQDSRFEIEITAADAALAARYGAHLRKTLAGTAAFLMQTFDEEYMQAVFFTRGEYSVTAVDPASGTFRAIIRQDIRGISPDMLAWWWDHIGTPARYRLWQPADHDHFEYAVPPGKPDLQYDVGGVQTIREYIGEVLVTLGVEGADPVAHPPPAPLAQPAPNYFNSLTTLKSVQEYNGLPVPFTPPGDAPLPPNQLLHQWAWNTDRSAVTLDSTFTLPAFLLVAQPSFGEDLGRHALREFQMMPYFLPRLYRREWLKESGKVKLTFARGAALEDPARLFNASLEGNARRAIDLAEGETLDAEAFKALIRAAVALNRNAKKARAKR